MSRYCSNSLDHDDGDDDDKLYFSVKSPSWPCKVLLIGDTESKYYSTLTDIYKKYLLKMKFTIPMTREIKFKMPMKRSLIYHIK